MRWCVNVNDECFKIPLSKLVTYSPEYSFSPAAGCSRPASGRRCCARHTPARSCGTCHWRPSRWHGGPGRGRGGGPPGPRSPESQSRSGRARPARPTAAGAALRRTRHCDLQFTTDCNVTRVKTNFGEILITDLWDSFFYITNCIGISVP